MNALPLESLEIEGFRLIDHLVIGELGRINLFVGKNSVGKTSILEALKLYADRNHAIIWKLLSLRQEGNQNLDTAIGKLQALRFLFNGRRDLQSIEKSTIKIGPVTDDFKQLVIEFGWLAEETAVLLGGDELFSATGQTYFGDIQPQLTLTFNGVPSVDRLDNNRPVQSPLSSIHNVYVTADGLDQEQVTHLWGKVALTSRKKDVLDALKIIDPSVEDIGIISDPDFGWNEIAAVKLQNLDEPIPLLSLGEGANRLFCLILALVNAQDGFLIVDEIESGIHYSIMYKLWQIIFSLAQTFNVQVFATTHSDDCIDTFQAVSEEDVENEGFLIRLENRNGKIVPVVLDEESLQTAVEGNIEVR